MSIAAEQTLKQPKYDQMLFRLPAGTKQRIESYRRSEGLRSWNEAASELLCRSLTEVEL